MNSPYTDSETLQSLEDNIKQTRAAYIAHKCAATLRPYLSANLAHLNSLVHPDLRTIDQYEDAPNPLEYADSVTNEPGYFDYIDRSEGA